MSATKRGNAEQKNWSNQRSKTKDRKHADLPNVCVSVRCLASIFIEFSSKKNDDFMSFACSCVAHRLLCTCPSRALFLARLLFNFMNTPAQTLYLHRVNLMRSFFAMKNLWHTLVGFALQTLLIVQNKMREPTAFAQFHAYIAHSPWTCVFIILIFLLTSILAHSFCALIHQSSFKCGCSLSLTLHVFMCVRYRIFWLHLSLKLFLLCPFRSLALSVSLALTLIHFFVFSSLALLFSYSSFF